MSMSRRTFLKSTTAAAVAGSAAWAGQERAAAQSTAQLQLVRNATCRITYGGKTILLDPWLGDVGSYPAVRNAPNPRPNPLVALPMPVEQVLAGVDATLITHTHFDHWDAAERNRVPKTAPIFVQPADRDRLAQAGYTDLRTIDERVVWDGITITRTAAQHGTGETGVRMGAVSGYVMSRSGLPTVYIAGDTVWFDGVAAALRDHRPDIVVVNAGEAMFNEGGPIIMGVDDVLKVCAGAPRARVIAVHLEAVNHCMLTRDTLRAGLERAGVQARVQIPRDGETLSL
jgi:hypothetical protein